MNKALAWRKYFKEFPVCNAKDLPIKQGKLECRKLLLSFLGFLRVSLQESGELNWRHTTERRLQLHQLSACQWSPQAQLLLILTPREGMKSSPSGKKNPQTLNTVFQKAKLRTKSGNSPRVPESINALRRPQSDPVEQKLLSWKLDTAPQHVISQEAPKTKKIWLEACFPFVYQ